MSAPPHDPGVDLDDDEGMLDAKDHQEAGAERPAPVKKNYQRTLNYLWREKLITQQQ